MPKKTNYNFKAKLWLYPGESANWHFITVPKTESQHIRETYSAFKKGWGSLPVIVTIQKITWETSIFPDTKSGTYLLPIKAAIRRTLGIQVNDAITLKIQIKP